MSDAEESIARTQAAAVKAQGTQGKALGEHQQRSIGYLNERILIFVLVLACLGLMILWATAKSAWLIYGSFAGVILLIALWGYARIQRIERERAERERLARDWKSNSND